MTRAATTRTWTRSSWPPSARREQQAAAAIIGYAGVSFLHQPDGALANDLALREMLVREIRTFRPDAVLATDPETLFHGDGGVNHTDHRAAGMAAVDAVYPAARNPMAFPCAGPRSASRRTPSGPAVPVLVQPPERLGRHRIHAGAQARRAARAHEPDPRHRTASAERIREWAAEEGAPIGASAAEALRVIVIDDDEDEGPSADAEEA